MFFLPAVAAPVPKGLKPPSPVSADGVWYLVEFNSDGRETPPQRTEREWVFDGESVGVGTHERPKPGSITTSTLTIPDPTRPHLRRFGPYPAVVEPDGDMLRFCYSNDGRAQLGECKPGLGVHYYVFERVKQD